MKLDIINKTYLTAYILSGILFLLYFIISEHIFGTLLIAVLLFFSFAFLNDIIENTKQLIKYPAFKLIGVGLLSLLTTYTMIITYQNINEIIDIDPSYLTFTSAIVFLYNLITIPMWYIGIGFFILLIISSYVIPFILLIKASIQGVQNKKEKEKKKFNWFIWISRFIALFAIHVAGNVFSEGSTFSEFVKKDAIYRIAISSDFNSKHVCTNSLLKGKPVLFLQKGYVLYQENLLNKKSFKIAECY